MAEKPTNRVEEKQVKISPLLDEIQKLFDKPVMITLMIHEEGEEDIILSDDDLMRVQKSLEFLNSRL